MPVSLPFFAFLQFKLLPPCGSSSIQRWNDFVVVLCMEPNVRIIRPGESNPPSLKGLEEISRYLDSRFVIPGTKIRFGFDPLLSLFPVFGDLFTFLISAMLIYKMKQHGASRQVVIKMMLNSTLDAVIGAIPLVGTVFDVFYRSNDRNIRLLKEHYYEGKHQGTGNGLLILVAIVCVLIVAAAGYGMWKLFEAIF